MDISNKIISVDGFYYSGSSAIIDLLKEFKGTSIFSYESLRETKNPDYENSYGEILFYANFQFNKLRQALVNKDISLIDLLIKTIVLEYYCFRLNKCPTYMRCHLYQTEEFRKHTLNLLFNILDLNDEDINFIKTVPDFYFPVHVQRPSAQFYLQAKSTFYKKYKQNFVFSFQKGDHYLYKIKENLSIEQFDQYVTEYMNNIFKIFNNKNKDASLIVLDQFLYKLNISDEKNFLQNCKQISVIRDPRDMYYWINRESVSFNDLEIKTWVNNLNKDFTNIKESDNRLIICLEDLVFKYEKTIDQICSFLGLSEKQHIYKQKYFDPEISKNSIGLWKKFPVPEVMDYIHKKAFNPLQR